MSAAQVVRAVGWALVAAASALLLGAILVDPQGHYAIPVGMVTLPLLAGGCTLLMATMGHR